MFFKEIYGICINASHGLPFFYSYWWIFPHTYIHTYIHTYFQRQWTQYVFDSEPTRQINWSRRYCAWVIVALFKRKKVNGEVNKIFFAVAIYIMYRSQGLLMENDICNASFADSVNSWKYLHTNILGTSECSYR
jgi:hypothetical protein